MLLLRVSLLLAALCFTCGKSCGTVQLLTGSNLLSWVLPGSWVGLLPPLGCDDAVIPLNGNALLDITLASSCKTLTVMGRLRLSALNVAFTVGSGPVILGGTIEDPNSALTPIGFTAQPVVKMLSGSSITCGNGQKVPFATGTSFRFDGPSQFNNCDLNFPVDASSSLSPHILLNASSSTVQGLIVSGGTLLIDSVTSGSVTFSGFSGDVALRASGVATLTITQGLLSTVNLVNVTTAGLSSIVLQGTVQVNTSQVSGTFTSGGGRFLLAQPYFNVNFFKMYAGTTTTSVYVTSNVNFTISGIAPAFVQGQVGMSTMGALHIIDARQMARSSTPHFFEQFVGTGTLYLTDGVTIETESIQQAISVYSEGSGIGTIIFAPRAGTSPVSLIAPNGQLWTSNVSIGFGNVVAALTGSINVTGFVPAGGYLTITPSTSVLSINNASVSGTVIFADVIGSAQTALGYLQLRGNVVFNSGCAIVQNFTQGVAKSAYGVGSLDVASSSAETLLSTCSFSVLTTVPGTASAIVLTLSSPVGSMFSLPPSSSWANVTIVNASLTVDKPLSIALPNRTALASQFIDPTGANGRLGIYGSNVVVQSAVTVDGIVSLGANAVLDISGVGAIVNASNIAGPAMVGESATLRFTWNDASTSGTFPVFVSNTMYCPFSVCTQFDDNVTQINVVIDLNGVPFVNQTTFAVLSDLSGTVDFASVTFVGVLNAAKYVYTKSPMLLLGSKFSRFDFFLNTTSSGYIPSIGCEVNPSCPCVTLSNDFVYNVCDPPQPVVISSSGVTTLISYAVQSLHLTSSASYTLKGAVNSLGPIIIDAGGKLYIQNTVSAASFVIAGVVDMIDAAKLSGRNVTFSQSSQLTMRFANSTAGAQIQANNIRFGGQLILVLQFSVASPGTRSERTTQSQTVTIAEYSSGSSGSFDSISTETLSQCDKVVSSDPSYGSSSMTVTVTLAYDASQPGCSSSGTTSAASTMPLSVGAIVGIAVGGVVFIVIVVIVILYFARRHEIKQAELMVLGKLRDDIAVQQDRESKHLRSSDKLD